MSRSLCLLKTLLMFKLLDLVLTTNTTIQPPIGIGESKVPDIKGELLTKPPSIENEVADAPVSLASTTEKFPKKPGPLITTTAVPLVTSSKSSMPTNSTVPTPTSTASGPSNNITIKPSIQSTTIIKDASNTSKPEKIEVALPEITTIISSTDSNKIRKSENTPTVSPVKVNKTSTSLNASSSANTKDSRNMTAVNSATTPTSRTQVTRGTTQSPTLQPATPGPKMPVEESSRKNPLQNGTPPPTASPDSPNSEESANGLRLETQPCRNNGDCEVIHNANCNISSKECTCKNGFSPINKTACGKLLGDPCDSMCDAHNSRCSVKHGTRNVCACEDGLTASRDRSFCYGHPLLYGDPCDHDDNCTFFGEHMQCRRHRCLCNENYVRWDGLCMEKLDQLNVKCDHNTQLCYEDLGGFEELKRECRDGFCKCKSKYAPHNGACKEKIGLLGAPCKESLHVCYLATDGDQQKLFCKNGLCQCKDDFVLDEGKCKKKIGILGSKCNLSDELCYLDIEGYHPKRHCTNGTCQCKNAFKSDGVICKQKIGLLGAYCNTSSEVCYIEADGERQNIQCINGVCECKSEFALKNAQCQRKTTCGSSHSGPAILVLLLGLTVWYLECINLW